MTHTPAIMAETGYDVTEPYHPRLVAISMAAQSAGFVSQPTLILEAGTFPKLLYEAGRVQITFGLTDYDDVDVVSSPGHIYWDAMDIATSDPIPVPEDVFATPEEAVSAAARWLQRKGYYATPRGFVRLDDHERFQVDLEEAGFDVEQYSPRGAFGNEVPAVRAEGFTELQQAIRATTVDLDWDTLGRGWIIYPAARS